MKEFLLQNWLAVAVAVYLVAMTLHGHYRGFVKQAVSLVAVIASLIIVNITAPQVKEYLMGNETIQMAVREGITSALEGSGEADMDLVEDQPSSQRQYIESMEIPQQLKDMLVENNNSEVYEMLGVERFADYISSYITSFIVSIISYVLVFIGCFVLIHLLMRWLDLVAKLPILFGLNQAAGAFLGLTQGLLFIWIGCFVLTIFSGTDIGRLLFRQIEGSVFLQFLYSNNILAKIAISILSGL